VTGQPLPMISMGGSSLLFTCVALGIIQSVSRGIKQQEEMAERLVEEQHEQHVNHEQEIHN
jgi:cell division protein FtsW